MTEFNPFAKPKTDFIKAVQKKELIDSLRGKDGRDGKDGINGRDGVNGRDGKNGKDGIDGLNGLNGLDGRNGVDGKDGQDGLGIKSALIEDGNLIVVYDDGHEQNVGRVVGNDGLSRVINGGGGSATQAYIPAEGSVTQQMIFFSQEGHTCFTDWLFLNVNKLSGGGAPRVTIYGYSYSYATDTIYEVFRYTIDTGVENKIELFPSQPFVIGGREVLYFEAETSTNNTVVNGRFSLIESRNS